MLGDYEAQGRSIWLIFAEEGPSPHPAVPLLVADVEDVYVREKGQWLFRSRQLTDVFVALERVPVLPLDPGTPEGTACGSNRRQTPRNISRI